MIVLSQGKTQAQAAASVEAGLRTVQRWCGQPEFQEAIRQAQRESYDQAIAKLVACSAEAVAVLATIAADAKVLVPQQGLLLVEQSWMQPTEDMLKRS